ncbi:MAG: PepSY domain-containing protein [Verrucomicrobiia bacterium]
MKINWIICSAVAAALLAGCCTEKGEAKHKNKEAKLMAEAKVSKETAEQTALAKVPNGTIKEAEIEKEHGKLIWSFDVATPDAKDITEVNVDAITGNVVSVEKEAAESEAKEAAGEKDKDNDKDKN